MRLQVLTLAAVLIAAGCVTVAPAATSVPPASVTPSTPTVSTPTPTATPRPPTAPPVTLPATPALTIAPPPTAVTTSQPTAGTDDGSVGEKIQIGDFQYVTMAEAEWSESGYQEFFEPAEGNVLYAFLMEFEGIDPEGSSYNPFYFDLIVDGFEYSYYLFGKEPTLQAGDLAPGATIRGWMTFEAPLADTVLLRYEPVMGLTGDSVEWTVTVTQ